MVETHDKSCDYSEYLGPDYQKTMTQGKKVPTIVYNHTGQFDWGWFLLSKFQAPTVMEIHWIAEKFFRNCIDANQCIVIKDFERKIAGMGDLCTQRIAERQKLIMDSE